VQETVPGPPGGPWTQPAARYPALSGPARADVVVVGGGIAGLTTAVLLARAGARVRVLEAGAVGQGTTGGSTAKVTALQARRLSHLREVHGDAVLAPYVEAQLAGQRWIEARAGERDVACGLERLPASTYVTDPERVGSIDDEAEAARLAGLPVEVVDDDPDLPFATARAVRLADQLQVDPRAWVADLAAEVAAQPGCAVHEGSRVVDVAAGHRSVATEDGRVEAGHVVLATLLPISDRGLLFARTEPTMSYGLALEVAGSRPPVMAYGADRSTRSLRPARIGEGPVLLVGGEGHPVGRGRGTEQQSRLLEWARSHFEVTAVRHRWAAHDLQSTDLLPFAGRADRLPGSPWVASGFGKWGLTNGTAAAMTIAGRITEPSGDGRAWDALFDPRRSHPLAGYRSAARHNAGVAAQMARGWASAGSATTARGPEVTRQGLVPTAAGPGGCRLSLACTHQRGIVRWNEAERTWDCPLHGSRFAEDGSVVAAPARRPLRRVEGPSDGDDDGAG